MDHLQSPKGPSYPPLEVPYLGFSYSEDSCVHAPSGLCTECDRAGLQGWDGFPDRMGYNRTRIHNGDLSKDGDEMEQPGNTAGFLQAWLYFGVIAFFFDNLSVNASFLRKKEDDSTVIDTSSLPERLLVWRRGVNAMSAEGRRAALTRLDHVLGQLDLLCVTYLAADGIVEDFTCPVSPEVALSIQILGETLNHAKYMAGGSRSPYVF
jgi:hypothetical protein